MRHFVDNKGRVGSSVILFFACIYLNMATQLPTDPMNTEGYFTSQTLPITLGVLCIICCLIKIVLPVTEESHDSITEEVEGYAWRPTFLLMIIMAAYTLSFEYLGFLLGTILLLFFGFIALKETNWLKAAGVATALTGSIWLVLTQLFNLHLSAGNLYYSIVGV